METRTIFLLSAFGLLTVLFILHLLTRPKSFTAFDEIEANRVSIESHRAALQLKKGQFALIIHDSDLGCISIPNPKPEVFESFEAALKVVKEDDSDDFEYFLVNHHFEVLVHRQDNGKITYVRNNVRQ